MFLFMGDNLKYYFLFVEAKVSSNDKPLKNGYYRMVNNSMIINTKVNYDYKGLKLVSYTPESYGNFKVEDTYGYSINLSAEKSTQHGDSGNNTGLGLQIGENISFSQTVYKDNITMVPKSAGNNVSLNYKFNNITNKNVNTYSPLNGDCFQRAVFIYELSDYNSNKINEDNINF